MTNKKIWKLIKIQENVERLSMEVASRIKYAPFLSPSVGRKGRRCTVPLSLWCTYRALKPPFLVLPIYTSMC